MKKILLLIILVSASVQSLAAETLYISDKQYVPLRSGPDSSYRITHRGLPSGTPVTVHETNEETTYARITTAKGTEGWIRSQYLMKQKPAAMRLSNFESSNQELSEKINQLNLKLRSAQKDNRELQSNLQSTGAQLKSTRVKLAEITRVSHNALTLDKNNQRLISDNEMLKNQLELIEADNKHIRKSKESQAILNGALAVLLGVIIALIVSRLWPKKRHRSEWA